MVVKEGDELDLGDQHLIIHTAPGHTPGVMFVEGIVLKDRAVTYKGIWGGGGAGSPGSPGATGYRDANRLIAAQVCRCTADSCLAGTQWLSRRWYP